MSDILLYLQLEKRIHHRFCTFFILCSLDALVLITYFRFQMAEYLKGTVLHFLSHHLFLFSEFRQVTKYYWRLEQYWSHLKNSSNISSISNSPIPHCLSKDEELGEEENLSIWTKSCVTASRVWRNDFSHTPLSGFIADFPAHWKGFGRCFIAPHLSWLGLLCSAKVCLFTAAEDGVCWIISWLFKVNQLFVLKGLFMKHLLRFWKYLALFYL